MTDRKWLESTDAQAMLKVLTSRATDRKLRLFACGCCRSIWKELTLEPVRLAVETAERYADGQATDQELSLAHATGITAWADRLHQDPTKMAETTYALNMHRMGFAANTAHDAPFQITALGHVADDVLLKSLSPLLLRCVIGNPFRRVNAKPQWRSADTLGLARAIYEDRVFDRLPILADAMMDAGCDDDQILSHCRSTGPHVRGCWVVDLVLEKT